MWELIRTLHLVAMAFFVGGQLMLAAVLVPVLRGKGQNPIVAAARVGAIRAAARRFATGSLVALGVLAVTGAAMASDRGDWERGTLHVKLALIAAIAGLIVVHTRRPDRHAIAGAVLAASLVVVYLGVRLAHGT